MCDFLCLTRNRFSFKIRWYGPRKTWICARAIAASCWTKGSRSAATPKGTTSWWTWLCLPIMRYFHLEHSTASRTQDTNLNRGKWARFSSISVTVCNENVVKFTNITHLFRSYSMRARTSLCYSRYKLAKALDYLRYICDSFARRWRSCRYSWTCRRIYVSLRVCVRTCLYSNYVQFGRVT